NGKPARRHAGSAERQLDADLPPGLGPERARGLAPGRGLFQGGAPQPRFDPHPAGLALTDKLAHPEKLASWSKHQFVFSNNMLGDILGSLEDTHGYRVRYTNAAARHLKIEGDINVASVPELLQTISTILH
nr:hypothetical protein [Tanacetum cinerariifolium]